MVWRDHTVDIMTYNDITNHVLQPMYLEMRSCFREYFYVQQPIKAISLISSVGLIYLLKFVKILFCPDFRMMYLSVAVVIALAIKVSSADLVHGKF